MKDDIVTRAILMIYKAVDIHRATYDFYISVSIGRMDADVHISHFPDGKIEKASFTQFSTDASGEAIADPELKKAEKKIDTIWKAVTANG